MTMVLWICVGVFVCGLGFLAVLLFDLNGKLARLERSIAQAQRETEPAVAVLSTFTGRTLEPSPPGGTS